MSLKGALTHHRKGGAVRSPRLYAKNHYCPSTVTAYSLDSRLGMQISLLKSKSLTAFFRVRIGVVVDISCNVFADSSKQRVTSVPRFLDR